MENGLKGFMDYAQLGVATFAIAGLVHICRMLIQFMGNHMQHLVEVLERLATAVDRLDRK